MKKILKTIACVLAVLVLLVAGYAAYVFLAYNRLEDNLTLSVENNPAQTATADDAFTVVSWNLGFGAYSDDYSFFMDGATESRAYSQEAVYDNIGSALARLQEMDADFVFLQEIDTDGTRAYHVDQRALVVDAMPEYGTVFAQNYDSPYLFYPVFSPIGANKSGQMTLSRYHMTDALRRSLPIESGFMKLFDLDRCYSVTRVPLENGKELCLFCAHLSAYTSGGAVTDRQIEMLTAQMLEEYEKGNYVVCGGDFNRDLLGNSSAVFGVEGGDASWAIPFPTELVPEGLTLVAPLDASNPVPSCRQADSAYQPGTSFVLTVDGFLVSDNVTLESSEVIDTGFAWSDHNPVTMTIRLN